MGVYYVVYRYYFYGKIQAKRLSQNTDQQWEELAQINKR